MNTASAQMRQVGVFRRLFRAAGTVPRQLLLIVIGGYQKMVSPMLPVVTLGACGCRFTPTCSHYAAEAIQRHGALVGTALALARLVKCTPLHPGGIDPVPLALPQRRLRPPTCHTVR